MKNARAILALLAACLYFPAVAAAQAPEITTLTPNSANAGGAAFTMTVDGSNFVTGATVQWEDSAGLTALTTNFVSAAKLTAAVPAARIGTAGTVLVTVKNPDLTVSNITTFTVNALPAPAISGLAPSSASAGGPAFTLVVNGSNFVSGATVRWDSGSGPVALTTTFIGAASLSASVPAANIAAAGTFFVTVRNPDTQVSDTQTFTVNALPAPAITTLTPSSKTAGDAAFSMVVDGSNFVSGAEVRWDSGSGPVALATSFNSASQLTAVVPAVNIAAAGSAFVTVRNPNASVSNISTFTINAAAAPTITGLNPSTATTGGPSFALVVSGTNFSSGSTVRWDTGSGPVALTTTFVNATQLNAVVPAANIASSGTVFVTVRNPDNSVTSASSFVISSAPAPTLSSTSPTSVTAGASGFSLTVIGTNFENGSTVQWNTGSGPVALTTTYNSPTQITGAVTAANIASAGTVFVTVRNTNGATSNFVTFTINAALQPPVISALTPNSATVGGATFNLVVTGSNFGGFAEVRWDNGLGPVALTTTVVSSTQLSAVVPAANIAAAGTNFISVKNPDNTVSNVVSFTVSAAAVPAIAAGGLSPSSTAAGGAGFTLLVNGSNFGSGAQVQWDTGSGPVLLSTTVNSSTQVTAAVSAANIATAGTVFVTVKSAGGAVSNFVPFTVTQPVQPSITGVSPSSATAGGAAFALVVTGTSFTSGAAVRWDNGSGPMVLTTTFVSSSQLTAVVPSTNIAATGTAFISVWNPDNASSNVVTFTIGSVPAPAIAAGGLSPASASAGGSAFTLLVTGSNFVSGAAVRWDTGSGPAALTTTFINATQLSATVSAAEIATAGTASVTVRNSDAQVSNAAVFSITTPPAPVIASGGLSPGSATAGGAGFTLLVTGSNFVSGAEVRWDSGSGPVALTTTFGSATQLTAAVPASSIAAAGTMFVTVKNPNNAVSNFVAFTVNAAASPAISSVTPGSATVGGASFSLVVTGSNFASGATVRWDTASGSSTLTTTFVSSSHLSAVVPAANIAAAGTAFISARNPDNASSNVITFTIGSVPAPAIASGGLSPASATAGGSAFTLIVTGSNFVSGAAVRWDTGSGPLALTTTFVSAAQLTVAVSAAEIAAAGTASVTVRNPDAQVSNAAAFSITTGAAPAIATGGLSPNSATVGGAAFTLLVTGSNFNSGSQVRWDSGSGPVALSTTFISSTNLSALVPAPNIASAGAVFITVRNADGTVSNVTSFTVSSLPAPVIASGGLSPGSATAGGAGFTLLVNGSNFVSGALVQWDIGSGPAALTTSFVSSTQLTAVVAASNITTAGTVLVTVKNPNNAVSNVATFTVSGAPQPLITTVTPASATAGAAGFTLFVSGANFVSGAQVRWDTGSGPTALSTSFVSTSQLTATVVAGNIAAAGTVFLTVRNPDGSVSNVVNFSVSAQPQPTLAGLSPNSATAGGPAFTMLVTGSNFVSGSKVQWDSGAGPVLLTTVFLNATQLTAAVASADIATAGTMLVTVKNPDNAVSNVLPFTVSNAAQPVIASTGGLTPASAAAGAATFQLLVSGANFVNGSTVYWNPGTGAVALTTTFLSSSQLSAQVPAANVASSGTAAVTVQNPSSAVSNGAIFTITAAAPPPAPVIASTGGVSPNTTTAGTAGVQLLVAGSNFTAGAVVRWDTGSGPQALTTVFLSASQLAAQVPASLLTSAGTAFITVLVPGSVQSNGVVFTVTAAQANPPPTIVTSGGLSPNSATAGGAGFQMIVTGSNFTSGSAVQWDTGSGAVALSTTFINATQLTAAVPQGFLATAGTPFVTVLNTDNQRSNVAIFTIAALPSPVISAGGLSPTTAVAGGASFQLGILGANFVPSSQVLWNPGTGPQALPTVYLGATQLTATVPAANIALPATVFINVQNPGNVTSNGAIFTVTPAPAPQSPAITVLNPTGATVGGPAFQLVVSGTGFDSGAQVKWNGTVLTTTFLNSTSLLATVPQANIAATGTALLTVVNASSATSNAVTFITGSTAAPSISAANGLAPASTTAGSPAFQLIVSGSSFVNGSTVQWNNGSSTQALQTTFISSTQLTAIVASGLVTSAGTTFVSVENPGGSVSNVIPFTVNAAPLPSISLNSGLSPASTTAGGAAFQLIVSGSNFVNSSVVTWNSGSSTTNLTTTYNSATQLTALVPSGLVGASGTAFIAVVNPSNITSNVVTFTISAAPSPLIANSGLNPSSATAGGTSFQLTVTGSNFVSGSTVQWNSGSGAQALTTSFVTSTQLFAVIPSNLIVTAGSVFVTVLNPNSGSSNSVQFSINPVPAPTAPTISEVGGLQPSSATAGGAAFQLIVSGTGFNSSSLVIWNSGGTPQQLTTTLVNTTQLAAQVPAQLIGSAATAFISVQNSGNLVSNVATFSVSTAPAPTIALAAGLNPSSATAGSASFQLTVTGSNFVNGSVVQWNPGTGPQSLATSFVSATVLSAVVPSALVAATGTAFVTVLNPVGGTSNAVTFTINAQPPPPTPVVNGMSPSSAIAGSPAFQLVLSGSGFTSGSVVQWNSGSGAQSLTTTFVNSTQLTAQVTAAMVASPAVVFVSVSTSGSTNSNVLTFTVSAAPPPAITAVGGLSPATATAGAASFQMSVTGANFTSTSLVQWNPGSTPQNLVTTFVTSTQLLAVVPAALIASPGTAFVSVQNPGSGSSSAATSNIVTFTVNAPASPAITALNPQSAQAGGAAFNVVVTGTNFSTGSSVLWNAGSGPQPLTTIFVDAAHLTAQVPANLIAAPGTAFVSVQGPTGGASNSISFTISSAPLPTINATGGLTPATAAAGRQFTLVVSGTNFVSGAVVQWTLNGVSQALTATFLSSTQLTATVPAAAAPAAGTGLVSVRNPDGASSAVVAFSVTDAVPAPPAIATTGGLSPSSAVATGPAFQLLITGTGFLSNSVAIWNGGGAGQPLPTVFIDATHLQATVSASMIAAQGTVFLTVQNTNSPAPNTSNAVAFTVAAAAVPAVASAGGLNPGSATAGGQAFTLTVVGANFVSGSVVQWNGGVAAQPLATVFVSTSQLTALVPATLIVNPALVFVSVQNPGGVTSNPVTFSVTLAPGPVINVSDGLSPNTAVAGGQAFQLSVSGSNFSATAVVQWVSGGTTTPLTTAFVSSSQLSALVPANLIAQPGSSFVSVQNPPGSVSNLVVFTVSAVPGPTISTTSGLNPSSATTGSASLQVTVTGTNFVTGSVVQWNTGAVQPLATGFINSTQLMALIPANLLLNPATALIAVVNPDKSISNAVTFAVTGSAPVTVATVTGISPAAAPAGSAGLQLAVSGSNFSAGTGGTGGAVVQWNGAPLPTTFVSATQLTAVVDASLLQSPGSNFVAVVQGNFSSAGVRFQVNGPTLGAMAPATVTAGGPSFTLTLTGTNFVNGSTAVWNGVNLATSFSSANQLTAQVRAELIASAGPAFVLVSNPGGATTTPQLFNVTVPAAPVMASLSPPSAVAGGPAFSLAVAGSGFVNGSVVLWNGSPVATGFLSATQLTALVDGDLIVTAKTVTVTVQNPSGAPPSSSVSFDVKGPVVASLSPNQVNSGDPTFFLTINGSNFVQGSQVLWNSAVLPTSFISGTQLIATVTADRVRTPSTVSVAVQNPGSLKTPVGALSAAVTLQVGAPSLQIRTSSLPDGVVGTLYGPVEVSVEGGERPYRWTVTAGSLPPGMFLSVQGGVLSGTPTGPGVATFTVTVTDAASRVATQPLQLRTAIALNITTNSSLPAGVAGVNYLTVLAPAGGTAPFLWTVSEGALPPGILLNVATGELSGIPTTPGLYSFSIKLNDGSQQFSKSFSMVVTVPNLVIGGPGASVNPAVQTPVTVTLASPFPVELNGTLTLSFASTAGGDDPAIQFLRTMGRTISFTIPRGSTQAVYGPDQQDQLTISTGTLAGTITITAALRADRSDITPNPAPRLATTVPRLAPVITSAALRRGSGGVLVEITGYATNKEVTQAALVFAPSAGSTLATTNITVPLASILGSWYQSSASSAFGSQFVVTIPVGLQGDVSAVGTVKVTLTNSVGDSAPVTAPLQ